MPTEPSRAERRTALTRERILSVAVQLADTDGIGALTMRSLAGALGAKPMAICHHVVNKEQILDGIIDLVFAEIDQPSNEARGGPVSSHDRCRYAMCWVATRGQ